MPSCCIVINCKRQRDEFVTFHRIPTIEVEIQYDETMNANNDDSVPYFHDMSMDMDVHDLNAKVWIGGNEEIFKEHSYAASLEKKINPCCSKAAQTIDCLKETVERLEETIFRLNEEIKSDRLELKSSKK